MNDPLGLWFTDLCQKCLQICVLRCKAQNNLNMQVEASADGSTTWLLPAAEYELYLPAVPMCSATYYMRAHINTHT